MLYKSITVDTEVEHNHHQYKRQQNVVTETVVAEVKNVFVYVDNNNNPVSTSYVYKNVASTPIAQATFPPSNSVDSAPQVEEKMAVKNPPPALSGSPPLPPTGSPTPQPSLPSSGGDGEGHHGGRPVSSGPEFNLGVTYSTFFLSDKLPSELNHDL